MIIQRKSPIKKKILKKNKKNHRESGRVYWYKVILLLDHWSSRVAASLSCSVTSRYSYSINQILVSVGAAFSLSISFVRVVSFFGDEFELVFAVFF